MRMEMTPFWWGFTHPFSKPHPWWSDEHRNAWCQENGLPWRNVDPADLCPICIRINRVFDNDAPIEEATHGSGGPGWEWTACWEHYKVISSSEWLSLTPGPYSTFNYREH